jgi:hypothetical protein
MKRIQQREEKIVKGFKHAEVKSEDYTDLERVTKATGAEVKSILT